jgi:hypothetical protein
MNYNKKHFVILFLIVCFIFSILCGCSTPSSESSSSNNSGTNDSNKDLEIKSIYWVDDGSSFLQYYTNDKSNYNTWGYSCPSANILSMNTSEIQIKKISGNPNIEYGMVFCLTDHNNFYRVSIIKTGYRRIERRINGIYGFNYNGSWTSDPGLGWPYSSHLNQGYGSINNIKVTRSGTTFNVYFNNNLELSFTDTNYSGGYTGGFALISNSNQENFPNTPVDVRFKLITAN